MNHTYSSSLFIYRKKIASSSSSSSSSRSSSRGRSRSKSSVRSASSSSRSPIRSVSISPKRGRSKSGSGSSSSDDEKNSSKEKSKKDPPKSGFANPLFMLNKKSSDGGKSEEQDVKKVLVEKLFSLLSNEENKEKPEVTEGKPEVKSEKTEDSKPRDKTADPVEKPTDKIEKVEKEKPLPLLYANNKVIRFDTHHPFKDLKILHLEILRLTVDIQAF